MKLQIIYELSETNKLCGVHFRIYWGNEARSMHSSLKNFLEIKKGLK